LNPAAAIVELQQVMTREVGPLRTGAGLRRALAHIESLPRDVPAPKAGLDPEWIDFHDLASMRLVAECVMRAALAREESRGAHQRADFPDTGAAWQRHLAIRLQGDTCKLV
jgi:succinate dehydrogenase / fumarate reductase flavoprotein subunit/fumarate reductase (CoM/CoB) subunit A